MGTLLDCLDAYQEWRDHLPTGVADSAVGSIPSLSCATWWSSWRQLNYPEASVGIDTKQY